MLTKKKMLMALGTASALAAPALAAEVPYTSVLGGTVTDVVAAGTSVREGDVLLSVDSLAGPMAAARADGSGTVKEVMIKPGSEITAGTVVVIVEEP